MAAVVAVFPFIDSGIMSAIETTHDFNADMTIGDGVVANGTSHDAGTMLFITVDAAIHVQFFDGGAADVTEWGGICFVRGQVEGQRMAVTVESADKGMGLSAPHHTDGEIGGHLEVA